MDESYYKRYEPIFGAWSIKKKLGEGNFGAVFEIEREDFGTTYRAALKTITIPKSQAELDSIMDDGMDATSAEQYLEQFVEKIVSEFVLMSKLKGNSHIVSYEDHQVIKHTDGIGWDILIRMELLTPLTSYMKNTSLTRRDVIKLGIDMCRALELCQKYNIIHRDIKPENIFISDSGDFKLGDFGIAKEVEKTQSGLTKTGTQTYMAPEVYKGQAYGSSVDMYSLGIVLYRLLNHNRAPFMPQFPEAISYSDRERALIMRMGGHRFPDPSGVEAGCRIAEIAMRACAFKPEDRYSSPTQMREDLESILYTEGEGVLMFPSGDGIEIKSVQYVSNSKASNRTQRLEEDVTELLDDSTEIMEDIGKRFAPAKKQKKKKSKAIIPIVAAVLVAAGIGAFALTRKAPPPPPQEETAVVITSPDMLEDPIVFKVPGLAENKEDLAKVETRLIEFSTDFKYYINKETSTIGISRDDLGKTDEEIISTIKMLLGKGEIKIIDTAAAFADKAITNKDLTFAKLNYDTVTKQSSLGIDMTAGAKTNIKALCEGIAKDKEKKSKLGLYVDSELKMKADIETGAAMAEDFSIIRNAEELIVKSGEANLARSAASYLYDGSLTHRQIGLLGVIIRNGMLSKAYAANADDLRKQGIDVPVEKKEEPKTEVKEQPQAENNAEAPKKQETTPKKQATTQKKTQNKTNTNKTTTQTQQQQTTNSQQTQQTTPPQEPAVSSGNNAGMPEVYIDFD